MRTTVIRGLVAIGAVVAVPMAGAPAGAAAPVHAQRVAAPQATPERRCGNTTPPSWFYPDLTAAARSDSSIPDSWGTSLDLARVVCSESSYRTSAENSPYYGLGQMNQKSVSDTHVSWQDYLHGSSTHSTRFYQLLAALRYCKSRYTTPAKAWAHEVNDHWW